MKIDDRVELIKEGRWLAKGSGSKGDVKKGMTGIIYGIHEGGTNAWQPNEDTFYVKFDTVKERDGFRFRVPKSYLKRKGE